MTHSFLRYIAHWPTSSLSLSLSLSLSILPPPCPVLDWVSRVVVQTLQQQLSTIYLSKSRCVCVYIHRVLQSVGHGDSSNICLCSLSTTPISPRRSTKACGNIPHISTFPLKNPYYLIYHF